MVKQKLLTKVWKPLYVASSRKMFHQDVILPAAEFAYDKLTELQVDTV